MDKRLEKKEAEIELEASRLKIWCLDRLLEEIDKGITLEELTGDIKIEKEVAIGKAEYHFKRLMQIEKE